MTEVNRTQFYSIRDPYDLRARSLCAARLMVCGEECDIVAVRRETRRDARPELRRARGRSGARAARAAPRESCEHSPNSVRKRSPTKASTPRRRNMAPPARTSSHRCKRSEESQQRTKLRLGLRHLGRKPHEAKAQSQIRARNFQAPRNYLTWQQNSEPRWGWKAPRR